MIRFFLRLDPDEMDAEEWAKRVNECLYGLEIQKRSMWGDNKD